MYLEPQRRVTAGRSSNRRKNRGAATVEFALVIALFFFLVFGGIEFVRMMMLRHTADTAAYEAARHAVVPGASMQEAEDRANAIVAATGMKNATVTVAPNPILDSTETVSVSVAIPVADNSWVTPKWFTGSANIAAQSTLMTERVPVIQAGSVPPPSP